MRKLIAVCLLAVFGLVSTPAQYHGQTTGGGMNHYSNRGQGAGAPLPPPILEPKDLFRIMEANNAPVQATVQNGFSWIEGQIVGYDGSRAEFSKFGKLFVVDNFPKLPIGTQITLADRYTALLQPGRFILDNRTQAFLYDYGKPYVGKAWTRSGQDQSKIDLKTFQWLSIQATNGSVSAQCRLGIYYLNGKGCQTNKEAAIYWLNSAANQGDFESSNMLTKIQSQTNSITTSQN
jgi:Sel1 repeat